MNSNKINFNIFKDVKNRTIVEDNSDIDELQNSLNIKKKLFINKAIVNNKTNVVNNIIDNIFLFHSYDCEKINYGDSYYIIDKETLKIEFVNSAVNIDDRNKVTVKNKENINLIADFILEDIYAEKKKNKKLTSQNRKEIWLDDDVLFRLRFKTKKLEVKSLKHYIEELVKIDSLKK